MKLLTEETTKEEVKKEYESYPIVDGNLDNKPFYQARYESIFYEIRCGSKVLDVGANDGTFMQMLKEKRQCDVYGIDLSEEAVKKAKEKGLNVQLADGEKIPFEDGTFDYVLAMELLSHLHDPEAVLREIKRVLKPKGILLGSCPHKNLETFAWEEARLHKRYMDELELHTLLGQSFDRNWIRVLKGGQFAISLANSFLAQEP